MKDRPETLAFHTDWKPPQASWLSRLSWLRARLDREPRGWAFDRRDRGPTTLDRDEVARFAKLAGEWWDANGPFKPLHRINPVRLTYIRDQLCRPFGRDKNAAASLSDLTILDIGCGGGLVAEPLARLGASVTGIDPAPENIDAAKAHAEGARLEIDYRATTAEALAAEKARNSTPCWCSK